ncbi:MAG TPA: hypothetical protein VLZ28_05925 [Daejeonella sp.]|nr:hypothetical protein [Daejeonella sp.]
MKTISLIILLQFAFTCNYAQSINYDQAVRLYNTWLETKGQNHELISSQLRMIDPKWAVEPVKPILEQNSKYFLWESPLANNKEKQQFAVYLEEHEKAVKYSITYVFYSRSQFDFFAKAIRAEDPKATRFINALKSETEVSSRGTSRSVLLREFPMEDFKGRFVYTLEIFSKYVSR